MADWRDQVTAAPQAAPAAAPAAGDWRSQVVPAIRPEPDQGPVDKLVKSSPYMQDAKNPYEGFLAGMQMSASVIPFHEPNLSVPANAGFFTKLSGAIGQGVGDLPANVAGFFGGATAGAAVPGAGETGVSEVAGGGFGAMALPQATREVMMDYYKQKNAPPMTASEFTQMVAKSAWNTTKSGVVGAVGGVVGGKFAGAAADAGGSAFSQTAANITGFTAGSTAAQAAIDHKMPDSQDFLINTIAALTLAGAGHYATGGSFVPNEAGERVQENLQGVYRQTGIPPWEAVNKAGTDPKLHDEMVGQDVNGDPVLTKFNQIRPPEPDQDKNPFSAVGPEHFANNPPEGLDSADVEPKSPLVVTMRQPDGTISYGKKGDIHSDLMDKDASYKASDAGFATAPGEPPMSRDEAAAYVKGQQSSFKTNPAKIANEHEDDMARLGGEAAVQAHVKELLPQVKNLETGGMKFPDAAISPTGAVGRYQVQPGTARQYGFDPSQLHDPVYNQHVASTILADLSRRFKGDTEAVLVAYNAGPGRAMQFIRDGRNTTELPYETQGYLQKAGFGGKGGEPPIPPAPPEEPSAQEPEGDNPAHEVPEAQEPDWSKLTDESMVSRFQDAIGEEPSRPSTGGNIMRQWVSELESARGIDQQITKAGLQDPSKDITFEDMMRQTYASDDRTNYMLMKGNIDPVTLDEKEGPALTDVLARIKDAGGNMDEFDAYRVAKRTLDLDARGIDTGVFKGGVGEAGNIVQRAVFQKYKAINDEMQVWKRGGLEYGRDSGLFHQGNVDAMEAASSHVSLRRIAGDDAAFKTTLGGPKGLKVSNPLKAMEGSNRQIVKPLLADIDNMRQIVRMSDRNRAIGHLLGGQDALMDTDRARLEDMGIKMLPAPEVKAMLAEPGSKVFKPYSMTPDQEKAMAPFAIESNKNAMTGNRFVFYRNGVPEVWEARDPYVAALMRGAENQGDATTISVFGHIINIDKILSTPAMLERAGIMGNLDTALIVPGKHQLTAWALDPLHPPPYITMVKGLHDALTKGDAYWDLMRRGGLSGAITDMDMAKGVDKAVGDQDVLRKTGAIERTWNTVSHPLQFAQGITEALTHAERIGYYKRAVAGGLDPNKAAMMGRRAYLDFSEKAAGVVANRMAKNIPFFRATLLGLKYVRDGVQADPKGAFLRVSLGLVGAQMALYALNRNADKYLPDNQKYSSLPQWERDQYYITPPIMGVRHKLSRPYVIGPMVGVPVERFMEAEFEKNPHAYDNFLSSWLGDMVPNPIPASVRPALEQVTNHNFFTGKPMVSDALKEATADQQYVENTSEVAKRVSSLLGDHRGLGIANVSPIVLDNYVQAWTGTIGMTILHALDAPLGKDTTLNDWQDNIFVKGFVVQNPRMSTQQIDDFYTDAAKFTALHRDVTMEAKEGRDVDALSDQGIVGHKASFVVKIEHALAVQRTALHALNSNKDMNVDEKRQLSERIYNDAWQLARFGSDALNDKTVSEDQAQAISDSAEKNVEAAVGQQ